VFENRVLRYKYLYRWGRKWREGGKNCIMRSVMICTLPHVQLELSSRGGLDGLDMRHEWGRREGV
jgi:hypothetical protein